MPKTIHQLRSPHVRLLASLLVMIAILCNNFGLAQAHAMSAKTDCCPEMTAHQMASDNTGANADNCPAQKSDCNDQCMARCMSMNGLLSASFIISPNALVATALPQLIMAEHSLVKFSPDLRPPIYS